MGEPQWAPRERIMPRSEAMVPHNSSTVALPNGQSVRVTDTNTRVVIRAEEAADQEAIAAVVSGAFGSSKESRLVAAIRASSNYRRNWSLVAVTTASRLVGHVMVSYVSLRDGASERRVPSLSPLSVDPDYQR